MEYRQLGRTGVKISPLCLGCMTFGGKTGPADAAAIIDRAIDAGLNFIDTANVYNCGRSEEAVGAALARNGKRDRVVLASKVHAKMGDDPNAQGNSRRHIIEQCCRTLERLGTEWIDLYQIHRPMSSIPIDETLRALDDLIRAGKVRYVGTSTFAAWQVVESLWVARELGTNRFVCEQPPYSIVDRRIERELLPMARTYGIAVIPWSPLAGGLLTGKYKRSAPAPEGSRFAGADAIPEGVYDVTEGLEAHVQAKGCTMSQFALAWCMAQEGVTSPIVGPRTLDQLEDNLGALAVSISGEDRDAVDALVSPGRMAMPFYEADFGPHIFRW